jgi:hypothetical protein
MEISVVSSGPAEPGVILPRPRRRGGVDANEAVFRLLPEPHEATGLGLARLGELEGLALGARHLEPPLGALLPELYAVACHLDLRLDGRVLLREGDELGVLELEELEALLVDGRCFERLAPLRRVLEALLVELQGVGVGLHADLDAAAGLFASMSWSAA